MGFTLIELLIAIAIIGIISVGAFVALDPLTRFQDARDVQRWNDVSAVIDAIKVDQIDNGGNYIGVANSIPAGSFAMIGTAASGCNTFTCPDQLINGSACVDFGALVTEGYLAAVPVAPTGSQAYTSANTGYYISRSSTGTLTVGACESENSAYIRVQK